MKNIAKRAICSLNLPTTTPEYGYVEEHGEVVFKQIGEFDDFAEIQKGLESTDDAYLRRLSELHAAQDLGIYGERSDITDLGDVQALADDVADFVSGLTSNEYDRFRRDPVDFIMNYGKTDDQFNYQGSAVSPEASNQVGKADKEEGE